MSTYDILTYGSLMFQSGIIAGSFDLIHPGYIKMFLEAKKICKHLSIALHEDPTLQRDQKQKCVLSTDEREEILLSIRYIDRVFRYKTEEELYNLLNQNIFDVRILGDDYIAKEITGPNLSHNIHYVNRSHGWSTTKLKKLIYENYEEKNE